MERREPLDILVVDDEEDICKMFTKWLSLEGYRVESTLSGKRALNLVEKGDYERL